VKRRGGDKERRRMFTTISPALPLKAKVKSHL